MELRAAVIRFVAIVVALMLCAVANAQDRVVLVASDASPIRTLSSFEVRKLFLGIDVYSESRMIRGLRNLTDPRLNEIFLQSVVGLSQQRYENRLLSNVFKYGTARPDEFRDPQALADELRANPYAVSYMWAGDEVLSGMKVLRVLWQEY